MTRRTYSGGVVKRTVLSGGVVERAVLSGGVVERTVLSGGVAPEATGPVLPAWLTHYWHGEDLPDAALADDWVDRVSGLSFVAAGAERPAIATTGGFKHLVFNGSTTRMACSLVSAQPNTIFVFGPRPQSPTYLIDGLTGIARNALFGSTGSNVAAFAGTTRSFTATGAKQVIGAVYNSAGQSRARGAGVITDIESPGTQNLTGLTLGDRYAPISVEHLTGDVYAVAVAAGYAATADEINDLVAYMVSQHGAEVI